MEEEKTIDYKGTSFFGTLCFFINHSCREICRRFCYFIISLLSCYLAISVALVANTVISNSPLLFLRMTEVSKGEIDFSMVPANDNSSAARFLNVTKMDSLVQNIGILAPRVKFPDSQAFIDKTKPYTLTLMLLDTNREKTIGIGRNYDGKKLEEGECAIHRNLAYYLNATINSIFSVTLIIPDYIDILNALYKKKYNDLENAAEDNVFTFQCKVAKIYGSLYGKVPDGDEDGFFYMEISEFLNSFANSTDSKNKPFSAQYKDFLRTVNPYGIVSEVNTNHMDRMTIYKNSDFDKVQDYMTSYASNILDKLGFFALDTDMPILTDLQGLSMAAVFLGIIMNLVVIILAAISSYLVYSLLMISFDTRIFEMGIFRLIGLRKWALVVLVIIQSLLFVLPALLLGIGTSFFYLYVISNIFNRTVQFTFEPVPSQTAFIWAICVGFIVPLIASFIPISNVLRQTLSASIDMAHSKSKGVHITIEYAQENMNWSLVIFGFIAIGFGLTVYYFLPLSLIALDFQLMLWLLLGVLLAFFIGLVMLALNIQHWIDLFIVYIVLFFETTYMKLVITKNLIAHKIRNKRTGIIFAVVIGFLLFVVVAYTLELANAELTMLKQHGAYLDVSAKKGNSITYDLVIEIEKVLDNNKNLIDGYSWVPQKLSNSPKLKMRENYIMDYARLYRYVVNLIALPPNFFEITNKNFLQIGNQNKSSDLALAEQLYTPRGSQSLATGSFIRDELGISINDPKSTFLLTFDRLTTDVAYESRVLFLLNAAPILRVSKRIRSSQDAGISYPLYLQFMNATSISLIEYNCVSIKVKGNNKAYANKIYDDLNYVVSLLKAPATVWSYSQQSKNIESVKSFLDVVFFIIIGLFMLLFVFSMISSMTANVLEQTKELAVLRAIGMLKWRGAMLYLYEAFVLVLSSSIIGCIIGLIVGYSASIQRNLYTDLPLIFAFPWKHLLVIVGCSIMCAGISAVSPAIFIMTQSVAMLAKS